jgi:hypothetical protein
MEECSVFRLSRRPELRNTCFITGRLVFFESMAGMDMLTAPTALLPKPPPQYSLMKTSCEGSMSGV